MATRGVIARKKTDVTFEGRYHHWDSYIEDGLGDTLCTLYQGYFKQDITAMLSVIIDEHPAGWSTIVDCDFSLPPGFCDGPDEDDCHPQCYCHGSRREEECLYTCLPDPNQTLIEYVYVIDEHAVMTIYHRSALIQDDTEYAWTVIRTGYMGEVSARS